MILTLIRVVIVMGVLMIGGLGWMIATSDNQKTQVATIAKKTLEKAPEVKKNLRETLEKDDDFLKEPESPKPKKSEHKKYNVKSENIAQNTKNHARKKVKDEEIINLPSGSQFEPLRETVPRITETNMNVAPGKASSSKSQAPAVKQEVASQNINLSKPPEPTNPPSPPSNAENDSYAAEYKRLNERLNEPGAAVAHAVTAPSEPVDPETEFYKNQVVEYQKLNERLKIKG